MTIWNINSQQYKSNKIKTIFLPLSIWLYTDYNHNFTQASDCCTDRVWVIDYFLALVNKLYDYKLLSHYLNRNLYRLTYLIDIYKLIF